MAGLVGRNGAGKTSTMRSIMGHLPLRQGSMHFDGQDLCALPPEARAALGIGYMPEDRGLVPELTVEENMTAISRPGPWTISRVYKLFPRLEERRRNLGNQLSGGEQQMLAIGRALVLNPRLVLLDEPTEGLAPIIVDEVLRALRTIAREEGLSMIIVEQKAQKILSFTDHAIILDRGQIVHQADSMTLRKDTQMLELHLGAVGKNPVS